MERYCRDGQATDDVERYCRDGQATDDVERYCRDGQATDDNIIRRMRIACWITEATNTHSEYIIFIAFPLQQWLHRRSSMLRYTYNDRFVVLEL